MNPSDMSGGGGGCLWLAGLGMDLENSSGEIIRCSSLYQTGQLHESGRYS